MQAQKFVRRAALCLLFVAFTPSPALVMAAEAQDPADVLERVNKLIRVKVNEIRKQHDLKALESNPQLKQAASDFAAWMAEHEKYGHHADGRTPAQRAKEAGYEYCSVRENIAFRSDSRGLAQDASEEQLAELAEQFVEGWMDSPDHRDAILAPYVLETGVGIATTDRVSFFAVQLFGRPKSSSLQISVTNSTSETVTLVVDSDGGSSDEVDLQPRAVLKMRRCYPLTLQLPDAGATQPLNESAEVVITSDIGEQPKFSLR